MLAAPVLLAALAMAYLRTWPRRLVLLAIITAAAVSVWQLVPQVQQRFAEGASPDGIPWAPKSQATLDRYRREGDGAPTRPLFGPSGSLNRNIFPEASADEVLIGSTMIYAAVQQFGAAKGQFGAAKNASPIPWGNIPARPFLGVSPEDEVNILATVEDYLTGAIRP